MTFGLIATPHLTAVTSAVCSERLRQPASPTSCDRLFEESGPTLRLNLPGAKEGGGARRARLKYLRVAQYSLKHFNIFAEGKDRVAEKIVQAIDAERPDILFLTEVQSQESLGELSRLLKNAFEPVFIRGNDESLIDIGLLIRKTLPLEAVVQSHRGRKYEGPDGLAPVFTRDLVLLSLRHPGDARALLEIAGNHFKANAIPKPGRAGRSYADKRQIQETTGLLILQAAARRSKARGSIFMGDLNADVRYTSEFQYLKEAGFQEALDVLGIPMDKRVTHTRFQPDTLHPINSQPDAIFLSQEIVQARALTSGYIVPDRTETGKALARIKDPRQNHERISDHKMEIVEIDITKLR